MKLIAISVLSILSTNISFAGVCQTPNLNDNIRNLELISSNLSSQEIDLFQSTMTKYKFNQILICAFQGQSISKEDAQFAIQRLQEPSFDLLLEQKALRSHQLDLDAGYKEAEPRIIEEQKIIDSILQRDHARIELVKKLSK